MKYNLIFIFLFLSISLNSQNTMTPTGNGTIASPYQIESLDNLFWLSQNSEHWDKYFIQTSNIDASQTNSWGEYGWEPIGTTETPFSGNYNGQDYAIENLFINRIAYDNIGFFGVCQNAQLQNIRLINVDITGYWRVGSLVGSMTGQSEILKSQSTGYVIGSEMVGGLVGSNSYSNISQSFSNCSVTGRYYTGGFVGENIDSQIINCYSLGDVTRNTGTQTSIAAFVGYNNNALITNSYTVGSVYYSGSASPIDKGFVGDGECENNNNYFDSEFSNQNFDGLESATPRTTSQMKQPATYTNWDFPNIWNIHSEINYSYPFLSWQILSSFSLPPQNFGFFLNNNNVILSWSDPYGQTGQNFEEGFEDFELPLGWQNHDLDGDGHSWFIYNLANVAHSGNHCMASASWTNIDGALTPENWLITPAINLANNAVLSWWIGAQDNVWFAENYQVKLSTTNSDPESFNTLLFSETLNQAGWRNRSIDLSAYNEQTIYLAFVHTDCTDNFYLKLDTIKITNINRELLYSNDFETIEKRTEIQTRSRYAEQTTHRTKEVKTKLTRMNNQSDTLTGYLLYRNNTLLDTLYSNALSYTDYNVPIQVHEYKIKALYGVFESRPVYLTVDLLNTSDEIILHKPEISIGNYPNPFNPSTYIFFNVIKDSHVVIDIFNNKGQKIQTLINERKPKGNYSINWDGKNDSGNSIANGIYFYKIITDDYVKTKKMVLIK